MRNRLGIFVFYDKQGKVDEYVNYLLNGIMSHVTRLMIVCNGKVSDDGLSLLKKYTNEVVIRENSGYDAMAYKLALTEYIGWDKVKSYDEVLLFNDTFYGPIYPFSEMFREMDKSDSDFWGITYHEKSRDYLFGTNEVIPAFISTYFCVYRKKAVTSLAFQNYWNEFDSTKWFFSDVCKHEQTFTKTLENAGLKWDTYIKTAEYNDKENLDVNVDPYYAFAFDIIKNNRCPILKRKNFVIKDLSHRTGSAGENVRDALEYVEKNTDYDANLIWDNILRLYNIEEIKNALNLGFVIPDEPEINIDSNNIEYAVSIIIKIPNEDFLWEKEKYTSKVKKYNVLIVKDEVELVQTFVDQIKRNKLVCVINMKNSLPGAPVTYVKSFNYSVCKNMIASNQYIERIIELFKSNKRLGVLSNPISIHGNYLGDIDNAWGNHFEQVEKAIREIGIEIDLTPDISCPTRDLVMWINADAIRDSLEGMEAVSEKVIARMIPYIAQSYGYYTASLMSTSYVAVQVTNLTYELTEMIKHTKKSMEIEDCTSIKKQSALYHCRNANRVAIYGAGADGIMASNWLKLRGVKIDCFIISDNQPEQKEKNGYPIYRLSSMPFKDDEVTIVICVSYTRDRNEIIRNLRRKGYSKYYIW